MSNSKRTDKEKAILNNPLLERTSMPGPCVNSFAINRAQNLIFSALLSFFFFLNIHLHLLASLLDFLQVIEVLGASFIVAVSPTLANSQKTYEAFVFFFFFCNGTPLDLLISVSIDGTWGKQFYSHNLSHLFLHTM